MELKRYVGPLVLGGLGIEILFSKLGTVALHGLLIYIFAIGIILIIIGLLFKKITIKKLKTIELDRNIILLDHENKVKGALIYRLIFKERNVQQKFDFSEEIERLTKVIAKAFPKVEVIIVTLMKNKPGSLLVLEAEGKDQTSVKKILMDVGEFIDNVKDSLAPDLETLPSEAKNVLPLPWGKEGEVPFLRIYDTMPTSPTSKSYSVGFDLQLGEANDGFNTPVGVKLEDIERHVAIFGSTGSGKTNTAALLSQELGRVGYRVIILDWHGEYSRKLPNNVVWDHSNPLKLNLLQGSEDLDEIVQILGDVLDLSEPQRFLLLTTLHSMKVRSRERLFRSVAEIEENSYWIRDVKYALARKLYVISSPKADILFDDVAGVGWSEILEKLKGVNIIDLSFVTELVLRRAYTLFLLKFLVEAHIRKWDGRSSLIVLEEAQNYLRDESQFIERVTSEVRKYHVGLCIVSQSPSSLAASVLKNTNTKIVHAIKSNGDKSVIRESMSLEEKLWSSLDKLKMGEAIVSSPSLPQPVVVKIKKV
jgi:hypothetical protein